MVEIELYFDGACRDNQSPDRREAAWGYVVKRKGRTVQRSHEYVGEGPDQTNNRAEYQGVIAGLKWLQQNATEGEIKAYGDSELIIEQIRGNSNTEDEELRSLRDEARRLLEEIGGSIEHVPRTENPAEEEANAAFEDSFGRT